MYEQSGRGSTFTITIPVERTTSDPETERSALCAAQHAAKNLPALLTPPVRAFDPSFAFPDAPQWRRLPASLAHAGTTSDVVEIIQLKGNHYQTIRAVPR
jgi:hypothetical protein